MRNFDNLASSGSPPAWVNNSTLDGWHLFQSGTAVTPPYSVSSGPSAGGFYSLGASGVAERALGGVGSGSFSGWIAASFVNASGTTLDNFTARWDGEQWRNSGAGPQTMVFQYGFGSAFDSVNWSTPGSAFNWTSPVNLAPAGAIDGNGIGRVSGVGGTISGISWEQNQTLWLRWFEGDDAGFDHALAIDNFSLTARQTPQSVPETLPRWTPLFLFLPLLLARLVRSSLSLVRATRNIRRPHLS
jgi:hypothetical protein